MVGAQPRAPEAVGLTRSVQLGGWKGKVACRRWGPVQGAGQPRARAASPGPALLCGAEKAPYSLGLLEVCGCVCSMALAAGFIEPASDPKDLVQVQKSRTLVRSLAEMFREKHGDIICRNLLQNKEQHSCIDYVAFSAEAIGLAINEKE